MLLSNAWKYDSDTQISPRSTSVVTIQLNPSSFILGSTGSLSVKGSTAAGGQLKLVGTTGSSGSILLGKGGFSIFKEGATAPNDRLGIGTTNPGYTIEAASSSTPPTFAATGAVDDITGPTFLARKARGTVASPAGILGADILGNFAFRGAVGSAFSTVDAAVVSAYATEDWIGASNGAAFSFSVTPNGSSTISPPALTIDQDSTAYFSSILDVTGASVLHSTLGVTGAATLSSTLNVSGSTTLIDLNALSYQDDAIFYEDELVMWV